jgi:hypothetical protein
MQATSVLARRTTLVQFVVLKREDKWVVKSKELERVFSAQHKAVEAAIKLANDSGKDGKPAVVLFQKTKADFQKVWTYGESASPRASSICASARQRRSRKKQPAQAPAVIRIRLPAYCRAA